MKTLKRMHNIIRKFIYKHIDLFMVFAVIMSFFINTLSYVAIIFFVWNFLNKKAYLRISLIFFTIAIGLNILYFAILKPQSKVLEGTLNQWETPGYHAGWKHDSQLSLNFLEKRIEWYKEKHGKFPNHLNDIPGLELVELDLSYRIRLKNGDIGYARFYYKKVDNSHYLLEGVGKDGKINTKDDLIPQITRSQLKLTGLLRYKLMPTPKKEIRFIKGRNGIQIN